MKSIVIGVAALALTSNAFSLPRFHRTKKVAASSWPKVKLYLDFEVQYSGYTLDNTTQQLAPYYDLQLYMQLDS